MDKRSGRIQPIRLGAKFFPLDIHKSMFINDLTITIPAYYVKSWGKEIIDNHNKNNFRWEVVINYDSPKDLDRVKHKHKAVLSLSFAGKRYLIAYPILQLPCTFAFFVQSFF